MKTNSEIRQETLALMKGNWSDGVLVTFAFLALVFACTAVTALIGKVIGEPVGGSVQEFLSMLVSILVFYPMSFSLVMLFLGFVRGEQQLHVGAIFGGFKKEYYGKSIGMYLLIAIFTILWTLLLIVPGIIKSLSYALAPYILAENPELTANEAINRSMEMMKGHRMDLFLMVLGYAGFALLSVLALGIPMLWLNPYYQAVFVKFYAEVKNEQMVVEHIA